MIQIVWLPAGKVDLLLFVVDRVREGPVLPRKTQTIERGIDHVPKV